MPVVYFTPRPPVQQYIQWTGTNAAEIDAALEQVVPGGYTVTDNMNGTITISDVEGAGNPISTGGWVRLTYPQSVQGTPDATQHEQYQYLPGGSPYFFGVAGSHDSR